MKRKRMVIDCRAATKNMSGVGRYILNLVKGIQSAGRFDMFLLVRENFHPELSALANAELVSLPKEAESIHYVDRLRWEQGALRTQLRSLNADLFHATWNYGIPWLPTCHTVLTLHDLLPMEFPGEFGSRSWRYAYLISQYVALFRASKIIAVSQYTKNAVHQYAGFAASKTTVVLEGVESEFCPPSSGLSPGQYLLYVGGYGERKNVGNLLRAYEHALLAHGVSLPLHLTGSIDKLERADRQVHDRLAPEVRQQIRFLGFVSDGDLPALYQGAAMLLFPSLGEGFGFPPLEAMACGTPVVTTACGSIPEIVGDAARTVDGYDPESIARGIADVAHVPSLRSEMVDRGLQRARALSWETCAQATMKVYDEILAKRSA